jgi:hypothetical protein
MFILNISFESGVSFYSVALSELSGMCSTFSTEAVSVDSTVNWEVGSIFISYSSCHCFFLKVTV